MKAMLAVLAVLACARQTGALDRSAAAAPNFVVDSDSDDSDVTPGDGSCASVRGTCTLRAAIEESNALASPAETEIRLRADAIYRVTHPDPTTESGIDGPSALLVLSSIHLAGDGATIQAAPQSDTRFRVFLVGRSGKLQATDLTITGGAAEEFGVGGGILNRGELVFANGALRGNLAGYHCGGVGTLLGGGGLYNEGTATLVATEVTSNAARVAHGHGGGGILNKGLLTLDDCTVEGNVTFQGDFAGDGAGIYNTGDLSIEGSRLRGNATGGDCVGGNGAAIYNSGYLRVAHTIIGSNATVYGGDGGAILNTGFAAIQDSELRANAAADPAEEGPGGQGGAIFNQGDMLLLRCTVADNTTGKVRDAFSGSGGAGGGVFNSGTLEVRDSTISGNRTGSGGQLSYDHGGHGGGVFNRGLLSLTNTTISDNRAGDGGRVCYPLPSSGGSGGGLYNQGDAVLRNATITGNSAGRGLPCGGDESLHGDQGAGGGVFATTFFEMDNTIIAGNLAPGSGPDCSGFVAARFSLIEDIAGCELDEGSGDDIVGKPPLLGPLADNGGPTLTHSLQSGSPAIGAGDPQGCRDASGQILVADQRGAPRAVRCDIGAFEVAALPMVTPSQTTTPAASTGGGGCLLMNEGTGAQSPSALFVLSLLLLLARRRGGERSGAPRTRRESGDSRRTPDASQIFS